METLDEMERVTDALDRQGIDTTESRDVIQQERTRRSQGGTNNTTTTETTTRTSRQRVRISTEIEGSIRSLEELEESIPDRSTRTAEVPENQSLTQRSATSRVRSDFEPSRGRSRGRTSGSLFIELVTNAPVIYAALQAGTAEQAMEIIKTEIVQDTTDSAATGAVRLAVGIVAPRLATGVAAPVGNLLFPDSAGERGIQLSGRAMDLANSISNLVARQTGSESNDVYRNTTLPFAERVYGSAITQGSSYSEAEGIVVTRLTNILQGLQNR
jgi:hypothetical protein